MLLNMMYFPDLSLSLSKANVLPDHLNGLRKNCVKFPASSHMTLLPKELSSRMSSIGSVYMDKFSWKTIF
jgi:hypothetical protein